MQSSETSREQTRKITNNECRNSLFRSSNYTQQRPQLEDQTLIGACRAVCSSKFQQAARHCAALRPTAQPRGACRQMHAGKTAFRETRPKSDYPASSPLRKLPHITRLRFKPLSSDLREYRNCQHCHQQSFSARRQSLQRCLVRIEPALPKWVVLQLDKPIQSMAHTGPNI